MEVVLMFLMDVTFLLLCIKMKFNTVSTADVIEAEFWIKQYMEVFSDDYNRLTYFFPASLLIGISLQVYMERQWGNVMYYLDTKWARKTIQKDGVYLNF